MEASRLTTTVLARVLAIAALALVGSLVGWSYANEWIVHALLDSALTADQKVDALRAFFHRFGSLAPLAYVAMVVLEVVVAPIPGTMLYAPGGVIFGGFWGGALSLLGNVLGAGLACQSTRLVLGEQAERYLSESNLARYEELIARRGAWVVFLLRLNPLTSSDLVSYAAGLTTLAVWKVMLGTLAGIAPLCFAQAYLADGLLTTFPWLIYPLVVVSTIYLLVAAWIVVGLLRKRRTETHEA
jgi:uncharacterized membrane protein YdjX (TVP38/TMEM64 family)